MIFAFSFPRVVYKQDDAPDAIAGGIWFDTGSDQLFYSDGTDWIELSISLGALQTPIIENTLAILEIFAADTLTADTSASMVRDVFSDTTGYLNTINTGSTTGKHSTDKYINHGAAVVDAHSIANGGTEGSQTTMQGCKIETNFPMVITKVTKHANNTSTKCYIRNSANDTTLATADFVGNDATFSYVAANATTYSIVTDNDGGSYTATWSAQFTYPLVDTNFDWTAAIGLESDRIRNIANITSNTYGTNKIVQTAAQDLPSTPTNFQVFAYKDTLTGTGTITADISFDNGANYQTAVPLNTATAIGDVGDEMILKINLGAGASAGTAECKGYGVLFW